MCTLRPNPEQCLLCVHSQGYVYSYSDPQGHTYMLRITQFCRDIHTCAWGHMPRSMETQTFLCIQVHVPDEHQHHAFTLHTPLLSVTHPGMRPSEAYCWLHPTGAHILSYAQEHVSGFLGASRVTLVCYNGHSTASVT